MSVFQEKTRFAHLRSGCIIFIRSSDATQIARAEIARAHHVHSHGTSVRHVRLLPSTSGCGDLNCWHNTIQFSPCQLIDFEFLEKYNRNTMHPYEETLAQISRRDNVPVRESAHQSEYPGRSVCAVRPPDRYRGEHHTDPASAFCPFLPCAGHRRTEEQNSYP